LGLTLLARMGAVDQKKWDNEHAITAYPYGIKPQATYKFKFHSRSKNAFNDCDGTRKLIVH
jgi:hypothetical protein